MRLKYENNPMCPDREFNLERVRIWFCVPTPGIVEKYYPVMPNFPIILYSHYVTLFHYFYREQLAPRHFEISFECCEKKGLSIAEATMYCNVDAGDTAANITYFPVVTDSFMPIEVDDRPVTKDELYRRLKIEMTKLNRDLSCGKRKRAKFNLDDVADTGSQKVFKSDTMIGNRPEQRDIQSSEVGSSSSRYINNNYMPNEGAF